MPQSLCLTIVAAGQASVLVASARTRSGGSCPPASSSPWTLQSCRRAPHERRRAELDRAAPLSTSSSIVCSMPALSSSPSACDAAAALAYPQRAAVGRERDRRVLSRRRASASQDVTSMSEVVPGLCRRALPLRFRRVRVAFSGPSLCVPAPIGIHRDPRIHRAEEQTTWLSSTILHHRRSRSTRPGTRSSTSSDWCRASREAGSRANQPGCGQGRDHGEDGRDVDDVHRHRRGRRAGRRGPPRGDGGQVEGGRWTGLRQRRRRLRALGRRRDDPYRRADHRQGGVHGRRRRRQRAGRDDQGLHRASSTRSDGRGRRCDGSARARCRTTAGPPSRTTPTGPSSVAMAPNDYVCVECGNVLATGMDPEHMGKRVRIRCGRCRTVNVVRRGAGRAEPAACAGPERRRTLSAAS